MLELNFLNYRKSDIKFLKYACSFCKIFQYVRLNLLIIILMNAL